VVLQESPTTTKLKFLQTVRELYPLARERLTQAQARYKENFDRSVRVKNKMLKAGDWVYLRKEVHDANVNPKLDSPAYGPFRVLKMDGHTLFIRQCEEDVRVSSDRVTAAPIPFEVQSSSTAAAANTKNSWTPPEDAAAEQEYVVEKISGAKQLHDGSLRYRIRWYGYTREYDTWKPAHHLPPEMLRRYHKRTRLPQPKKYPNRSLQG
jgi:Chromo (CHRromatin Organisation MOdifier) domain